MLSLRSLWDIQKRKAGGFFFFKSGAGKFEGYSGILKKHLPSTR